MRLSETDLLHLLIERVPFVMPEVRVFRRNIINVMTKHGRVRNGIKGQSDAYAIVRGGRHVEVETKSATGSLTKEQRAWLAFCEKFEIPHLVLTARKGEDSDATVSRWISELQIVVCA